MKNFNKKDIIKNNKINEKDTGSSEVQIFLLTARINYISEHLKKNKKDNNTKSSLSKLVCRRKKLLNYLKKNKFNIYEKIVIKLDIKKN